MKKAALPEIFRIAAFATLRVGQLIGKFAGAMWAACRCQGNFRVAVRTGFRGRLDLCRLAAFRVICRFYQKKHTKGDEQKRNDIVDEISDSKIDGADRDDPAAEIDA